MLDVLLFPSSFNFGVVSHHNTLSLFFSSTERAFSANQVSLVCGVSLLLVGWDFLFV